MELPINMIVIIAVAVLVLTVIAAFFTGALGGGQNAIATEQAFQKGCQLLRTVYACNSNSVGSVSVSGYSLTTSGGIASDPQNQVGVPLLTICNAKGAGQDSVRCAQLCGCI